MRDPYIVAAILIALVGILFLIIATVRRRNKIPPELVVVFDFLFEDDHAHRLFELDDMVVRYKPHNREARYNLWKYVYALLDEAAIDYDGFLTVEHNTENTIYRITTAPTVDRHPGYVRVDGELIRKERVKRVNIAVSRLIADRESLPEGAKVKRRELVSGMPYEEWLERDPKPTDKPEPETPDSEQTSEQEQA